MTGVDTQTARRGTVLVVDDEEGVRASIRAILEETCDVLEAGTGAQALEVMKAHEIDLVMLDQRMPGEAGIDVLPRIKAADPSTVVVIAPPVAAATEKAPVYANVFSTRRPECLRACSQTQARVVRWSRNSPVENPSYGWTS